MSFESDLEHLESLAMSTDKFDFIKEVIFVRFKYKLSKNKLYNVEGKAVVLSHQFYNHIYGYLWHARCVAANFYRDLYVGDKFIKQTMFMSIEPAIPVLNKFFMDYFEFTKDEVTAIQKIVVTLLQHYPTTKLHESEYAWCIAHNPSNELMIRLIAVQTVKDSDSLLHKSIHSYAPPDMRPLLLDMPDDYVAQIEIPEWAKTPKTNGDHDF